MPEISHASRQLERTIKYSHIHGPVRVDGTVDQARFPFFGKLVRLLKPSDRKSTWKLALDTLGRINPGLSEGGVRKALRHAGLKEGGEITVKQLREAHSALHGVVAKHRKEAGGRIFVPLDNESTVSRGAAITKAVGDAINAVGVLRTLASALASDAERTYDVVDGEAVRAAALAVEDVRSFTVALSCRAYEEHQRGRGENLASVVEKINVLHEEASNALGKADSMWDNNVRVKAHRSLALRRLNSVIDVAAAAGVDKSVVDKARDRVNAAAGCDFSRALAFRGTATEVASLYSGAVKAAYAADKAGATAAAAVTPGERDEAFRTLVEEANKALDHLNSAINVAADAGIETTRVAEARARVDAARCADLSARIATAARIADAIDADLNTARVGPEANALYRDVLVGRALYESRALGRQLSEGEQTKLANEAAEYVHDMLPAEATAAYEAGQKTVNLAHKFAADLAEADVESGKERARLVSSLSAFVTAALDSASNAALRPKVDLKEEPHVERSLKMGIERAMAELTEKQALEMFIAATATDGAGRALLVGTAAALAEENRRSVAQGNTGAAHSAQTLCDATEYLLRALGRRGRFTEDEIKERLNLNIDEWPETVVRSARDCKADITTKFAEIGARIIASAAPNQTLADARAGLGRCAADFVHSGEFVELLKRYQRDTSSNLAEIEAVVLEQTNELVSRMPASKLASVEGKEATQREADRLVARIVRTRGDEIGRIAKALPKQVREDLREDVDTQVTRDKVEGFLRDEQFGAQLYSDIPNGEALGKIRALVVDRIVHSLEARDDVQQGSASNLEDALIGHAVRAVVPFDQRGLMAELNNHPVRKRAYLDWKGETSAFENLANVLLPGRRAFSKEEKKYYNYILEEYVRIRGDALCATNTYPDDVAGRVLNYISKLGRAKLKERVGALDRASERAMAFAKLLGEKAPSSAKSSVNTFEALKETLHFYGEGIALGSANEIRVNQGAQDAHLIDLAKRLPLSSQLRKGPEALFNDALKEGSAARQILAVKDIEDVYSRRGKEGAPHTIALAVAAETARFLAVIGLRAGLSSEEIKGRLLQAGASENTARDAVTGLA